MQHASFEQNSMIWCKFRTFVSPLLLSVRCVKGYPHRTRIGIDPELHNQTAVEYVAIGPLNLEARRSRCILL